MKELSAKELKSYFGTGNRPQDFDHFWDQRIRMLDQVSLEVNIVPVFKEEFEHFTTKALTFKSYDGANIHAKYIRPKGEGPFPCVLQFHGYPGSSRPYFEHASFVDAGMAVIAMDCRGQGGLSEDRGGIQGTTVSGHLIAGLDDDLENMLYVKIYSDVYLLSRIAQNIREIDSNKIYANGASQGAALAAVCSALNPMIKKAALLYPFLSDFERVFDLDFDLIAYEGLRYYSRWFDPDGCNRKKMFERLAYIDVRNFASRIQVEVLFGISMADTVCPISTQYAVFNNLKCKKSLHRYPGKGHEPIYAFDDMILPFFGKNNKRPRNIYSGDGMNCHMIGNKETNLIILFQPNTAFGLHHLRRYSALGFDVLTVSLDSDTKMRTINERVSIIESLINRNRYKFMGIVAEDSQARTAIHAAIQFDVDALVLQTPVGLTKKEVMKAKWIKANVLIGLAGLDEDINKRINETFVDNLKTTNQVIKYPKYGRERINAFEDRKLVFLESLKSRKPSK